MSLFALVPMRSATTADVVVVGLILISNHFKIVPRKDIFLDGAGFKPRTWSVSEEQALPLCHLTWDGQRIVEHHFSKLGPRSMRKRKSSKQQQFILRIEAKKYSKIILSGEKQ